MTNTTATPRYNIDTCSVLVEFSAPVWTARKLDRTTTDEVVANKNARAKDAARVNKHLLAGRSELEDIQKLVTRARNFTYENTLPWSDAGLRLLPTKSLERFTKRMSMFEEQFNLLVEDFVRIYPSLITAQAMALGDMFKRDDYPSPRELPSKFGFRLSYLPVPTAGDFRVDIGNAAREELAQKLEKIANERVAAAMNDVRERLSEHLKRMSDRLTSDIVDGESKNRRFHDTLIEGALDLCDLTKGLNIVNDPEIEAARLMLENALVGVTADALRRDETLRNNTKQKVDEILDKFSF